MTAAPTQQEQSTFDITLSVMGECVKVVGVSADNGYEAQHLALAMTRQLIRVDKCEASRAGV